MPLESLILHSHNRLNIDLGKFLKLRKRILLSDGSHLVLKAHLIHSLPVSLIAFARYGEAGTNKHGHDQQQQTSPYFKIFLHLPAPFTNSRAIHPNVRSLFLFVSIINILPNYIP
jgi:hypothetical protein